MAWDSTPPTQEELSVAQSWDQSPPTKEELASLGAKASASSGEVSKLESLLRGGVQSATANLSDEAVGAYNAPSGALKALSGLLGRDVSNDEDVKKYMMARDAERAKNDAAHDANPKTYVGGQLAGGLATAFAPGLNAASLEGAATLGGISALGGSNADLAKGDASGALKDTAIGAGTGAVLSKVGDALGGVLKKGSSKLQQDAGDTALGALGISSKEAEKELGAGRGLFAGSVKGETGAGEVGSNAVNFRKGMGQEALNKLSFTGGAEGVREKVLNQIKSIIDEKAPLIADANQALQTQMQAGNFPDEIVNKSLGDSMREILDTELLKLQKTEPNPSVIANIEKNMGDYIGRLQGNDFDIAGLESLKQDIGGALANKAFQTENRELATSDAIQKDFYGAIKNRIEQLADAASPEAGQTIRALNERESNLLDLSRMTLRDSAKELAKKSGGYGDMSAFAAGSYLGGLPGGVAAYVGKKTIEKTTGFGIPDLAKIAIAKGESNGANIGNFLAGAAEGSTGQKISNLVTPLVAKSTAEHSPDYMTKLSSALYSAPNESLSYVTNALNKNGFQAQGDALQKAIDTNDSQRKNAVLFSILQDPKKRALLHTDNSVK